MFTFPPVPSLFVIHNNIPSVIGHTFTRTGVSFRQNSVTLSILVSLTYYRWDV